LDFDQPHSQAVTQGCKEEGSYAVHTYPPI
jgi:hypothetical protein